MMYYILGGLCATIYIVNLIAAIYNQNVSGICGWICALILLIQLFIFDKNINKIKGE